MTSKLSTVAGHVIRMIRTSFAGELGWQLHIPTHACEAVYNAVTEEGLKYGLRHAGYRALYSLSCEKGKVTDLVESIAYALYVRKILK